MNDETHPDLRYKIVMKKESGWGIRALARHFSMGRNKIRKILRKHNKQRNQGHDLINQDSLIKRTSMLDTFEPAIKIMLEKYPEITGVRVYEKLREEEGYTGGISILRERLNLLRPKEKEPVIRFETEPGQQGQMDWSPYKINFKRTGKSQVQCFSYILGFSRRHYIDFTLRHDFYTLIRRHQDAFEYFGGVPKECLYDNEKTVVLRWEAGRPIFNPAFTNFITHYQCKPIACRPRRPQCKGKVEIPFQYVEKNLLGGRDFQDMNDLRSMARWWLKNKSDLHIHHTTRQTPLERFSQEQLQLLPLHPYDSSEVKLLTCDSNGYVNFDTNHYSVPCNYIADILNVKATEHEILVYSPELDLIARHERQPMGSFRRIDDPEHKHTKKDRYGLEPVKEPFLALGEAAEDFLKGLVKKYPRNCGAHARAILSLKKQYNCDDIHQALLHASRYHAYESSAIERILMAKATPRTLESIRNEQAGQELKNTLPKITQRSLDDYGALLEKEDESNEQQNHYSEEPTSEQDQESSDHTETHSDPESA